MKDEPPKFWWYLEDNLKFSWLEFLQKEGRSQIQGRQREAVLRLHACDYTRLNSAPSLSVVLNLPVLEVCCRPQHPVKEYRLVVIGSVTTEGTRQQMPNIKKNASGVEMSCEQLGSTTEHLRGVIDSLSMLLKARGSFRLCWGVCVCFFFFALLVFAATISKTVLLDLPQQTFRGRYWVKDSDQASIQKTRPDASKQLVCH